MLQQEETLKAELLAKFPFLQDKIRVQRERRLWVDAPAEQVLAVFDYLVKQSGFNMLCTITGLDLGSTLGVLYHMARESGVLLTLATAVPKEKPVLQTVTGYFPAADAYEREMNDLLGMQVQGLVPGQRYPLPDDWPAGQFPLRKDWDPATAGGGKMSAFVKEPPRTDAPPS